MLGIGLMIDGLAAALTFGVLATMQLEFAQFWTFFGVPIATEEKTTIFTVTIVQGGIRATRSTRGRPRGEHAGRQVERRYQRADGLVDGGRDDLIIALVGCDQDGEVPDRGQQ